ncbi:bifunctional folylpolyglutamate synthase/dihydrofolate synthase [Tetragenococcus koreensis]|uniref:tetrahydrofolate synthase n=1 Tax=Tetragenococcus koreensis TaxID=290335 RepID=A0AAN4ZNH8_9ENTE|nr:folylpolyglutamate synthase/dihydrofolate synthase family protein [Tetragenococcus koreensis]GEQ49638.1 folylpolyglutamate synthase [Tetragenococcus koreensis]GEQ52084.1 folylpolyglutamate synthase [Tetragenococcus koreensis]GEQ54619.1 folylpolyglutamate synthase [Tetragenococcus koreensis]GEQ57101.1 folylpolyglutamate synthase [Tetragenococcus koreensis]GEQ59651.1 folylpolyglutamate synthase [Tetragenococcus koreensis]
MIKTGLQAINWIHSRKKFGSRPGLMRIKYLLSLLDNPEKEINCIHIAGTNGKGSTVSYLCALLGMVDLRVGTFTSPYVESFYERISINGRPIAEDDFLRLTNQFHFLVEKMDKMSKYKGITEFEILTAMALVYFKKKVDVAIFEVGIGGILDSTNVIQPILTAITTVGLDHTDILGQTLIEIANHKSGIIKPNIPIVTGNITKEALNVIKEKAREKNAPLLEQNNYYFNHYCYHEETNYEVFNFENKQVEFNHLEISLLGRHQIENAGVALELFYLYCDRNDLLPSEKAVRQALKDVKWPARMEVISKHPLIIMDGAHNPHAIRRLVENLENEFSDKRCFILMSALSTKDVSQMIQLILQLTDVRLILTSFNYPNCIQLTNFEQYTIDGRFVIEDDWKKAFQKITLQMDLNDLFVVTGSLYFVSEVRQNLKNWKAT